MSTPFFICHKTHQYIYLHIYRSTGTEIGVNTRKPIYLQSRSRNIEQGVAKGYTHKTVSFIFGPVARLQGLLREVLLHTHEDLFLSAYNLNALTI